MRPSVRQLRAQALAAVLPHACGVAAARNGKTQSSTVHQNSPESTDMQLVQSPRSLVTTPKPIPMERLMRWSHLGPMLGVSRSLAYAWMKDGKFPRPVTLGTRCVAWRESEVRAWLDQRQVSQGQAK